MDGFPGDEDNGSINAWFILSVIGLYPLVPGENTYFSIYQHYQTITLHLENGKEFVLKKGDQKNLQYSIKAILSGSYPLDDKKRDDFLEIRRNLSKRYMDRWIWS